MTDRAAYRAFLDEHCITTFMQSEEWADFEILSGNTITHIGVSDSNRLLAICSVVSVHAKKGTFLFIPHGPILHRDIMPPSTYATDGSYDDSRSGETISQIFSALLELLIPIARDEKASFIRFNTSLPNDSNIYNRLHKLNMRKAPLYLTSENAAVLPIHGTQLDTLLQNMRKTTRYSIKKAEKDGVQIVQSTDIRDLETFFALYEITTSREQFTGFKKEYLVHEFEAFHKSNSAFILIAKIKNEPMAAGLFLKTKNGFFYHQGASKHSKVPAPYLLQWHAIQLAQSLGCSYYNFWGTHIPGRTPPAWAGLTLFKTGYSPQIWSYLPTLDYVIQRAPYSLIYVYEQYLRIRRGIAPSFEF